MPPKARHALGRRFKRLPNTAQNQVARLLDTNTLRAMATADATLKPLYYTHRARRNVATGLARHVRDKIQKAKRNATLERVRHQRSTGHVTGMIQRYNFRHLNNANNNISDHARSMLAHLRQRPELGRKLYREFVNGVRKKHPNAIINFVEFDVYSHDTENENNMNINALITAGIWGNVHFVLPNGTRMVNVEFTIPMAASGFLNNWGISTNWGPVRAGTTKPNRNVSSHLPYILLPNGEIVDSLAV
jgi:hypothetical protein